MKGKLSRMEQVRRKGANKDLKKGKFKGKCFTCNGVGHRAYEWPKKPQTRGI